MNTPQQRIEHPPDAEIPEYLSDEYFRLREQEKAYLEEARHFRTLATQAETLEECLQLFDLAWKAEGQAFALAWRTLESMAMKNTSLRPPQGGNKNVCSLQGNTPPYPPQGNTPPYPPQGGTQENVPQGGDEIVSLPVGGIQLDQGEGVDSILQSDLAGEFEMLLAQEQRNFPVQELETLWTEDDREVNLCFWLIKDDRSQEEAEEQIDSFLGNLERKSHFEITKHQEIDSLTGINCTIIFTIGATENV